MANPVIDVAVDIRGLEQALKRLKDMPDNMQKKYLKSAMRKGANVVKRAAVRNYKQVDDSATQEKIWKNIVVQFASKSSRRSRGIVMRVGMRGGAKKYTDNTVNRRRQRVGKSYATLGSSSNPGGDTWYWRFLELGTRKNNIQRREFMIRALSQNAQRATDTVARDLIRQLDKGQL